MGKKWLVAAAAFAVVSVTLVYILRFTPLVPDQVARAFTENLLRERGYRLQIATVRGNPLGDLQLTDVRLLGQRGANEREVARVREIQVRVHPLNLFRGRVEVRALKLIEPYVHVGGEGVQRDLIESRAMGPRAPMPLVRIHNLEIANGHVAWERDSLGVVRAQALNGSLDFTMDSRHIDLGIRTLSVHSAPYPRLDQVRGRFVWAGDSLACDEVRLETRLSRLQATGVWVPAEARMRWTGEATPFHLDDLRAFSDSPVSGTIDGPFTLTLRGEQLDIQGQWTGRYEDYPARDVAFDMQVEPGRFELRRARGLVGDRTVDLTLWTDRGRVEGTVQLDDFDCQSLDASWPSTQLTGSTRFSRRDGNSELDLDVELQKSRVDRWHFDAARAYAQVRAQTVRIDSAVVRSSGAAITFRGHVDDGLAALDWNADVGDLDVIFEPLGVEGMSGRVEAQGTLTGPIGGPVLTGSGDFWNAGLDVLRAASGEFDLDTEDLSGGAPLHCNLRGENLAVAGRTLSRFTGQIERTPDEVLHVRRAEASRGDTLVAMVADLRSTSRDWRGEPRNTQQLRLETALVQAGAQEVRVEDPATVSWTAQQVRVDSLRVVTRGGSMRLDGSLDFAASLIDARTEVRDFDLEFVSRAMRLDSTLVGVATGWVEAHGSLNRTLLDARVGVRSGRWNSLDFDNVQVDLQSDAFGVELRALDVNTGQGNLSAAGRLAYLPGLRRWLTAEEGARSREELAQAQVAAELECDSLVLERFWLAALPQAKADWGAVMSARTELSGTVGAPRVTTAGAAHAVRVGVYEVDSLRFEARYADGTLGMPSLQVNAAGAELQARGRIPLSLHLAQGMELQRDDELEAHLRIDEGSFAVVPHFISLFEPATRDIAVGQIRARLDVGGSINAPELRGDVSVDGAGFTLASLEEIYRDVHMAGVFEGNTLQLSDMRARSGNDGVVGGRGFIVFDGLEVSDYNFDLHAENVPIYSVPQISATVDGQIEVRATSLGNGSAEGTVNGSLVPDFRGTLHILEADITQEFTSGGEPSELLESTDQPAWLADVTLDAPGRVRVKNSNADAELTGSVQLVRNRSGLDVQGQAQVKRGQYTVYLERFEITRGVLDFSRHPGWEPELDLEAQRGRLGDRIYIHLTGTPSQPNLAFTGDAPGTADDYQDRLIGGDRNLANDAATVASAVATQALVDLQYIDSFSINPDAAGSDTGGNNARSYNVSAGWEVSDRVFVTYTQGINESDLKQSVSIELDLLRNLLLESSWERRNFPTLENQPDATQDAFDFDLKFRWEY